jgi:hypothetical protein
LRVDDQHEWRTRRHQLIIACMEVLLGYVLGLGTVLALAKRGSRAKEGRSPAQDAIAWTARQVGAMSARVSSSLGETARVARDAYARGREQHLAEQDGEAHAERLVHRPAQPVTMGGDPPSPSARPVSMNGN